MHLRSISQAGLLAGFLGLMLPSQAQPLVWLSSLDQARGLAPGQGKLILLMAGRPTCGNCAYMKDQVSEDAEVRSIIDEACIPWFSDIDHDTDWLPYRGGLASFSLPLACVIDPATTNAWLARRTGLCAPGTFEDFLRSGLRLDAPRAGNLTNEQVIGDAAYRVTGRIWTNAQPIEVRYRVTPDGSAAGSFEPAAGTTDWAAPLGPALAAGVPGRYTFDVHAVFADESSSPTNRVVFHYDPAGSPAVRPEIVSIGVTNGIVSLMLTNLTVGSAVRVERAAALGWADRWLEVTNFVSRATAGLIAEDAGILSKSGYYRVVSPAWQALE